MFIYEKYIGAYLVYIDGAEFKINMQGRFTIGLERTKFERIRKQYKLKSDELISDQLFES